VLEIAVIAELRRKGFSLQKIRRVLRFLQKEVGKRISEILAGTSDLHLVTDGKSIYLEENQSRIIDLFKAAKLPMFLVCLSDQVRRIHGSADADKAVNRKPVARETSSGAAARKAKTN
jgi:DNA-binding transcriptional MerR regulator